MRSRHAVVLIGFMGVFVTTSLYGQWVAGTGQMSTGNYVAIGNSTSPHVDTALRLSAPVGRLPDRPCTTSQPVISDCLQLGFGTPAAMWWGFKLDANNDLHLIRQNGTWKDGMTFTREGKVAISGGSIPLRIDAANAGGFGVEFLDLTAFSYPNSMAIDMGGPNSHIRVANLQLSNLGVPVVRSTTDTSPLYLNLWTHSDVVIGSADTSYANMGLRVEGQGKSTFRGAVGIGTTAPNPLYKLHVVGNANFDGTVTGTNIKAHYQDVAEWVPAAAPLAPATVVVLDPARPNHVSASSRSYDTSVAGVVSAQPGIVLGDEGPSKALIATTGRVLVRVDASRQSIAIGDLLVTSDKPGVAMKSIPIDLQGITLHRPGTVVGKALEPLADGEGEILVLLSLQ